MTAHPALSSGYLVEYRTEVTRILCKRCSDRRRCSSRRGSRLGTVSHVRKERCQFRCDHAIGEASFEERNRGGCTQAIFNLLLQQRQCAAQIVIQGLSNLPDAP